jgi:hypothetical protein
MMHNEILSFLLMCFTLETKRRREKGKTENAEAHFFLVMASEYCEMVLRNVWHNVLLISIRAKDFTWKKKFISIPYVMCVEPKLLCNAICGVGN